MQYQFSQEDDLMKVQIYGDSLMKGVLVDENFKYKPVAGKLLQELTAITGVVTGNRAHFGYTVDKGQAILKKDLQKGLDCEIAVIEFGGNDCDFNWSEVAQAPESVHHPHTPIGQFLDAVAQMAKSLKDAGVKPVLMSLPPLDAQRYLNFIGRLGNNTTNILHWLGDVNRIYRYQEMYSNQISRLAAKLNLPLIDVRSRFLDRRDCGQLIARDGIHLTEAGYRLLLDEARLTLAGMSAY